MNLPETLFVGESSIERYDLESWEQICRDPRGILLMFEPPDKNAHYIMGLDATEGITGWTRATRTEGDHKTDNGAIEIFRVNGMKEMLWTEKDGVRVPDLDPKTHRQKFLLRDVQVAEFAAPCDAVEIARIANILGRIYCGDADEQCELIWEAWPGVGMLATQELLRLGYSNLWHWEYIVDVAEETNRLGWRSTRESQRVLWYRARRHLMQGSAVIRSRFLLDEYASAEIDLEKMRARAAYGYHDDRFQAANMCFWAGHDWVYNDVPAEPVTERPQPDDYQRMAPTLDDYQSFEDWKKSAVAEMEE